MVLKAAVDSFVQVVLRTKDSGASVRDPPAAKSLCRYMRRKWDQSIYWNTWTSMVAHE